MKKTVKRFAILWGCSLIIAFFAMPNDSFFEKIGVSLAFAAFLCIAVWAYSPSKKAAGKAKNASNSRNRPQATESKPVYIHRAFANGSCAYRIEYRKGVGYIFEGMSGRFSYRIIQNKVYRGMEPQWIYRIEGNRVYRGMDRRDPLYRVEGNVIYQGVFGNKRVYTIEQRALK